MKVFWFTGRSLNDMCSTTQTSLASGLVNRGIELMMINPDEQDSHDKWPWSHISIPINARPGFRSRALGKKMLTWCEEVDLERNSVCLLDWRVANYLIDYLEQRNIPWILIDRSPPADSGLLSLLQWPLWRKSWKMVREKKAKGCVVSQGHQEFIERKIGMNSASIIVLPAGVDLRLFHTSKKLQTLTLVYHGKLDKNRGVLALPMFLQKVNNSGIDAQLIVIGDGDCYEEIKKISLEKENVTLHSTLSQSDLSVILSECHIGLLPMPNQKVWRLASPLKRSEYAASGLLILGINHRGHSFENQENLEWMKLLRRHEFQDGGINWIQSLGRKTMLKLGMDARRFAEENLSWEHSVDVLEKNIHSCSNCITE